MKENFELFVKLNIYALLFINGGIVFIIYIFILTGFFEKKRSARQKNKIELIIEQYLKGKRTIDYLQSKIKTSKQKIILIDEIIETFGVKSKESREIVKGLKLDEFLIKKLNRKNRLYFLSKLAFLESIKAYEPLLNYSKSKNIDQEFLAYYGLSNLKINLSQKTNVIKKILSSNLLEDRKVELLNNFEMEINQWLDLLGKSNMEKEKTTLLKNILSKQEIKNEDISDKIYMYINDEKEVRIAAINIICKTQNSKYIGKLYRIYQREKEWEVRAAIAKGLSFFPLNKIKDMLLEMIDDKEWWVRFNVVKTISMMGEEGVYMLIDLSVDKSNENNSALAYYFLNSNKEVKETVEKL